MVWKPEIGASGMRLPVDPFATSYVAPNGKTYQYGPEVVLEHVMQSVPATQFLDAMLEVVMEAPHQGWEGYNARDLTGVRKFMRDLVMVVQDFVTPAGHVHDYYAHMTKTHGVGWQYQFHNET